MTIQISRSLALGLLLTLAGATGALAAPGKLTGVTAAPNPAAKGANVSITLTKTGTDCGFKIDYGDGGAPVGPVGFTSGSKVMTHAYAQAGSYTISVFGKKKGNKPKCKGATQTTQLTVTGGNGGGGTGGSLQRAPTGSDRLKLKAKPTLQLVKLAVSAVVSPAKDHAKFNVTANRDSILKLRVFGLTPPPNKRCNESVSPLKATFALGKKSQWNTQILGLDPNKKHYWEVCAKDSSGNTAMANGTFKTANWNAVVSFDMISITDDSDDFGAGEMHFVFEAGGKKTTYSAGEMSTGEFAFTGKSIRLSNVSSVIPIRIRGGDNDGDGFVGSVNIPDSNYEDWGEIKKSVALSDLQAGSTMYTWTAADHGLGFKAQVTVTLTID